MRIPILLSAFLALNVVLAQDQIFPSTDLDDNLTANANAILRLDEMEVELSSFDKMTIKGRIVTTVLNKDGDQRALNKLSYNEFRKIKSAEVVVYDKYGTEIDTYSRRKFFDVSAVDGISLYNDDRLIYHRYVPIAYPYTISFTYEVETSDTGFFPPWYFLGSYEESVAESRFSIIYPDEGLKPIIKEINLEGFDFQKKESVNRIDYTAKNIPAFKYESLSPSFRNIAPRLMTRTKKFQLKGQNAEIDDWKEFGQWVDNALLQGRDRLEIATINKVQKLVEGISDPLEKAKIIYRYVQENTRYVSVQIGIGGWQPISAIEVDKVKYGDCKGLSNYTKALLKAVGVEAYYVVVHAGSSKTDFNEDFAVLQGNHAILAIPYNDSYYWIDCTSQINPFGYVGSFTDDRNVLVVTPDGGKIVKTVAYLDSNNHQKTTGNILLKKDASIEVSAKISSRGSQYNSRFRIEQETEDDIVKGYKKHWDNINNLKIEKYSFSNDKEEVVFNEDVQMKASDFATLSGERMLFPVNVLNKNQFVPPRYRNRKLAFEISRGYLDEDETVIQMPEDHKIEAMPENVIIENQFGSYSMEITVQENNINYKRKMSLKHGLYPKTAYKAYRDFRREIAKADNAKIVLIKS